jgi:hypothetical protein
MSDLGSNPSYCMVLIPSRWTWDECNQMFNNERDTAICHRGEQSRVCSLGPIRGHACGFHMLRTFRRFCLV